MSLDGRPFLQVQAVGVLGKLKALLRRRRPLLNLQITPAYAVKASRENPYFQALERAAADNGLLGTFVVDEDGTLWEGSGQRLPTHRAELYLDAYPNPAALEGRTVANYEDPQGPRRVPRVTVELEDDTELFLALEGGVVRAAGPALERARAEKTGGGHESRRLRGQARG